MKNNLEDRMEILNYHALIKRRREEEGDNIDINYGSEDFNEVKDFIERKLREFQHSEEKRIIIDLERIK